jgi:hypothetical protein
VDESDCAYSSGAVLKLAIVKPDAADDSMTAMSAPTPSDTSSAARETLSQLVARILDQLSLSAWLPSAALVGVLLVIVSVNRAHGHTGRAVDGITSISFPSLLLLIGAVILATTLTQAFEFEAIRLLEGYWGPGRVRTAIAERLCLWQTRRRAALTRRHDAAAEAAFDAAMPKLLENEDLSKKDLMIMRTSAMGLALSGVSANDRENADAYDWLEDVPASPRRRLDAMAAALRRYPSEEFRILPTRLGNALRYHEEKVHDRGVGDLEHYVQSVFHELPSSIQVEHDQFRSRLDLYCSLVVVFAVSGVLGIALLAHYGLEHVLVTGVLAAGLTLLSYRAAVASASPYGGLLEVIVELRPPGVRVPAA